MSHVRMLYFIMKKCHKTKTTHKNALRKSRGAFFMQKNEVKDMECASKPIICPKCGRKVGTYDGRSTIDQERKCTKCEMRVVYLVETGETIQKPLPVRYSASGMRFI